jgi:hypothetical protein
MFGHLAYPTILLATISSPSDFPVVVEPKPPVPLVAGHPQCYRYPSTLQRLSSLLECQERLISYHEKALQVDRRRLSYENYLGDIDGKVRFTRGVFLTPENRGFYEYTWKPRILALQRKYGREGIIAKHIRIAGQSVQRGLDELKKREYQIRWLPSLPR